MKGTGLIIVTLVVLALTAWAIDRYLKGQKILPKVATNSYKTGIFAISPGTQGNITGPNSARNALGL
ncbi:hypothetical protein [Croceimicrobium hydrocarbonivorans]|uniref:Uncharacterized protein n=1 Tax=Croceimicrobium hydrocarbonivorans TaxID=2761580 RepID=A0A7H0VBA4_9FLAO|nr:hypothetical protein [Croceimicrobium hydrocarbonivorans]QNR22959.1 hypothetical protein H4K34_11275 [Croceimicrobium hydrocarbonivorans]QNR23002.1 hypothetical protein H4K34_11490 [Croceimicrobium hydrocarbonivorans]